MGFIINIFTYDLVIFKYKISFNYTDGLEIYDYAYVKVIKDFNILYIDDPVVQNYIRENVANYKKDW